MFEERYCKCSGIKQLTLKDMIVKHPVLGSMFVYDDIFSNIRPSYAVAWTVDRRATWYMRLKRQFRTPESAEQWLNVHLQKFTPPSEFLTRYKSSRTPRDSQKKRVYDWENSMVKSIGHLTERFKTQEETMDFINTVYETIGVPLRKRPTVWFRQGRTAYYWFERHILKLPMWAWNRHTIIHEIAHNVTDWAYGQDTVAVHGSFFVKTYLELLFLVTNDTEQKYILDTCREHRVKFKEPDYSTYNEPKFQSAIRRRLPRN